MEENNGNTIQSSDELKELDPFQHMEEIEKSLKALNRMTERPSVEIEFQNITFTTERRKKKGQGPILRDLSGKCRPGELTAIMGPSGAGKSTLLNILTGYNCSKIEGKVLVNGEPRNTRVYNKLASYIMQDDLLQPCLTVQESMDVATNLKVGRELGEKEKRLVIEEVLNALGLQKCKKTFVEKLSGGQRKRVSIALELVSNPPVLFLDEPTTGLDIVAAKQCISLLKILVKTGRTIVCTIHQPTYSVLSLFDNTYVVAQGCCVYNGSPFNIVPFMKKAGYNCPSRHNPADFILETVHENADSIEVMSAIIDNGKICETSETEIRIANRLKIEKKMNKECIATLKMNFPTSFLTQFLILYKRMTIQKWRNKVSFWIMVLYHTVVSVFLSSLFYNVGSTGDQMYANFKFCLAVVIYATYTYMIIPVLLYPFEVQRTKREHFNRWYGFNAYFFATNLVNLPFMVVKLMIAIMIIFYTSGQAMELRRFLLYCTVILLTAICGESFGLAIASMNSPQNGAILGPAILIPCIVVAQYGVGFGTTIEKSMDIVMHTSTHLRYCIEGLTTALLEGRGVLECPDIYCHYANSEIFLRDLGMLPIDYIKPLLGATGFIFLYKLISYIALRNRIIRSCNTISDLISYLPFQSK